MKKLFAAALAAVTLLATVWIPAYADHNKIAVYLDGTQIAFDVEPQIIDGRTMVSIRAIFEHMGAEVLWDGQTGSAVCTRGDTVVKMTVDSPDLYINGQLTQMDVPPVVIDGRTLAPARYAAEAFGATVQWSQKNNAVVICSKDVYAYADYPDIPDLGKCYNIPPLGETYQDGFKLLLYRYSDMADDGYYSYLYDHSASVLGGYTEELLDFTEGAAYIKPNEIRSRYYVTVSHDETGAALLTVWIPDEAIDGNWVRVYAANGKTTEVLESELSLYLQAGWYRTPEETQQTLYHPDGSTKIVFKAEVPAYLKDGWYEHQYEAQIANYQEQKEQNASNSSTDIYYYRTPNGTKYHLSPSCGGGNSYKTKDIAGLSPCSKCVR